MKSQRENSESQAMGVKNQRRSLSKDAWAVGPWWTQSTETKPSEKKVGNEKVVLGNSV